MDLLLMLILSALVTWMVERTADAALNMVIKKLRHEDNSICLEQDEEER